MYVVKLYLFMSLSQPQSFSRRSRLLFYGDLMYIYCATLLLIFSSVGHDVILSIMKMSSVLIRKVKRAGK